MHIELSIEEVNQLLVILGEMPTKTMVYPLAINIKQQADRATAPADGLADKWAVPTVPATAATAPVVNGVAPAVVKELAIKRSSNRSEVKYSGKKRGRKAKVIASAPVEADPINKENASTDASEVASNSFE